MTTSIESPISSQLIDTQIETLTSRLDTREQAYLIEKKGIDDWRKMSLAAIRSELEGYQANQEAPAKSILAKFDAEFPSNSILPANPVSILEKPKFTEHPIDWAKQKMSDIGDWMYDALPENTKDANEKRKEGASPAIILTTAVSGKEVAESIESAQKALTWWDKFRSDPMAFFKDLWKAITSGSWEKIKSFFSSTMNAIGITTDMATGFSDKIGLPKGLVKTGVSLFTSEGFGKMDYASLGKIYTEFQKNPEMDIAKKLGIAPKDVSGAIKILEAVFSKKSSNPIQELSLSSDIAGLSMTDIIKKITL